MASRQITAGSFSRLDDFESCALKAKYKYVDRIPEPDRGPPPRGAKEWANDRGSRIHDEAEQFVTGKIEALTPDLMSFSEELTKARTLYQQGMVETEQMWCFDDKWNSVAEDDYKNTRFRIKCDLTVHLNEVHSLVVDYKTGRRYGNEIKHEQQKTTYAVGGFRRSAQTQKITTELWYLDLPTEDIFPAVLTRKQGAVLLKALDARNRRMLDATVFPPTPSAWNCRFCPYNGSSGEQVCPHAVTKSAR